MNKNIREAGNDYRDTLYTVDKQGKRKWVYPTLIQGTLYHYRLLVAVCLLSFYIIMPWVTIRGKQGIFLDVIRQKFTFFGTTFFATDTVFVVFFLVGLALSLFFFTALFGRVWCGWACPETLFLEFVFRPIEVLIEGNAAQRARLDAQPWNLEKIRKKLCKHSICASIAWVLASTFLAYFLGKDVLLGMMSTWPHHNPLPFALTVIFMGIFGFQFGWFREQFCTVLCPYARFQSVLMDAHSLVVGYDQHRGEPRGKLKRGDEKQNKGDCIDCKLCVRVCPTGIDIRNGLQLECVSCTQCVDACDSIMVQIGKPKGLIRYDTENRLSGKASRIIRPRIVLYAVIILIYISLFVYVLGSREGSDFHIVRMNPAVPYSVQNGDVSNQFRVRITNKLSERQLYTFHLHGLKGASLIVPVTPFPIEAESIDSVPIFIRFAPSMVPKGEHEITIEVRSDDGFRGSQVLTLLGPESIVEKTS